MATGVAAMSATWGRKVFVANVPTAAIGRISATGLPGRVSVTLSQRITRQAERHSARRPVGPRPPPGGREIPAGEPIKAGDLLGQQVGCESRIERGCLDEQQILAVMVCVGEYVDKVSCGGPVEQSPANALLTGC